MLEEKLAYLRELQELNEEEERKKAEKQKNHEKRVTKEETDSAEWRTLKVDIDLVSYTNYRLILLQIYF